MIIEAQNGTIENNSGVTLSSAAYIPTASYIF
jgi:hypothetical protein